MSRARAPKSALKLLPPIELPLGHTNTNISMKTVVIKGNSKNYLVIAKDAVSTWCKFWLCMKFEFV